MTSRTPAQASFRRSRRRSRRSAGSRLLRRGSRNLLALFCCYVLTSYIALPLVWRQVEEKAFADSPTRTESRLGIPGDPLNVALAGGREEVIRALLLAGWQPADPITLKTALSTAASLLLNRPYPTAPVSNLYLWGRKQDLAFQRVTGKRPTQRHHVRLWMAPGTGEHERPLWIGAATFDTRVGFNRFTGQLTHHIDPAIDAERDTLMEDLLAARQLTELTRVHGLGTRTEGRNAQGDRYVTDGELALGVIPHGNAAHGPTVALRSVSSQAAASSHGFPEFLLTGEKPLW
ncbi:MAG: LssY C-terminal domain-containing protein [Patescibacteria group bacterium]